MGAVPDQVRVQLAVQKKLAFSGMFMTSVPVIQASATAAAVQSSNEVCMLGLEKRATKQEWFELQQAQDGIVQEVAMALLAWARA